MLGMLRCLEVLHEGGGLGYLDIIHEYILIAFYERKKLDMTPSPRGVIDILAAWKSKAHSRSNEFLVTFPSQKKL